MRAIPSHPAAVVPSIGGVRGDGVPVDVVTLGQPVDGSGEDARFADRWPLTRAGVDDANDRSGRAIPERRIWIVGRWRRGASWSWCYLP